jgi:hypothetical protein
MGLAGEKLKGIKKTGAEAGPESSTCNVEVLEGF